MTVEQLMAHLKGADPKAHVVFHAEDRSRPLVSNVPIEVKTMQYGGPVVLGPVRQRRHHA